MPPAYIELHCRSNYSFLTGASHPDELVVSAAMLGMSTLGLTDHNSMAGLVRAHLAAKQHGIRLLPGVRLDLRDGPSLLAYPMDRAAHGRLSQLLTVGKRRAPKGECWLDLADLDPIMTGHQLIALPPETIDQTFTAQLIQWKEAAGDRLSLAAAHGLNGDDALRIDALADLATETGIPLVAVNDVLIHGRSRKRLLDVVTCIRHGTTLEAAGFHLSRNGERHLKSADEMAKLFKKHAHALARTVEIAEACHFSLDALAYEYPDDPIAGYDDPQTALEELTAKGAKDRYPGGVPARIAQVIQHELAIVKQMAYAPYFLTVYDIVRFARSRGILCQGRGSAANSAVCYCLGITAVDPDNIDLLFERFISPERNEPPDIDVDFEHERREEVIQYIYEKYGRHRAGLAATVISYRSKSAIRDVGKVFGLSEDMITALSGTIWGRSRDGVISDHLAEIGLDGTDRTLQLALELSRELIGFPRHLSQHVGGMVITRGPLSELCPIANAAMEDRTTIEWDKDDLDALGILKIDILALGMLSCIRKCFELISRHHGRRYTLATIPQEDVETYEMLSRADTVGVFQVESRAQMSMLPRLKPRTFYDLVIEVAIVRPGPIQGDMVHPYLRRRNGEEPVEYPSRELEAVLSKTLGVPLFQEQAMKIAIVAAGFTPARADGLRRAMATFRRNGQIHGYRQDLIDGMVANGYDPGFAERCFKQIEGFGEYGFPESHAASFALLAYVSSWLKRHYPSAFTCALLNSQPMGFYAPAQLLRDAREHGVRVLPLDINRSGWDNSLEFTGDGPDGTAIRIGLRQVKGLKEAEAEKLLLERGNGYWDVDAVWRRAKLPRRVLEKLAEADAFAPVGLNRRAALWQIRALGDEPLPLFAAADPFRNELDNEPEVELPELTVGEEVMEDYRALKFSLRSHPVSLLRHRFAADRVVKSDELAVLTPNKKVAVAGLVTVRQRPGTASGIIFMTVEDETGVANLIVRRGIFEKFRAVVLGAPLVVATGKLQREGIVIHVLVDEIIDRSALLPELLADPVPRAPVAMVTGARRTRGEFPSRDFH